MLECNQVAGPLPLQMLLCSRDLVLCMLELSWGCHGQQLRQLWQLAYKTMRIVLYLTGAMRCTFQVMMVEPWTM